MTQQQNRSVNITRCDSYDETDLSNCYQYYSAICVYNSDEGTITVTLVRAMKERTATAVNITVGISITTAEPILVLKKVMVASQPL